MTDHSCAYHYQVIARDEGLTGQDDGMLRAFYAQWSRMMERSLASPGERV